MPVTNHILNTRTEIQGLNGKNPVRLCNLAKACFGCHSTSSRENKLSFKLQWLCVWISWAWWMMHYNELRKLRQTRPCCPSKSVQWAYFWLDLFNNKSKINLITQLKGKSSRIQKCTNFLPLNWNFLDVSTSSENIQSHFYKRPNCKNGPNFLMDESHFKCKIPSPGRGH